ncbi:MAG: hypothetical protein ACE5GZ_12910, partial [Gammaproteobacteria bacterium]
VTANGAGTVTLDANGNQSDLTSSGSGTIVSGSGQITLTSDDDVSIGATVGAAGTSAISISANVDAALGAGETGILSNTAGIGNGGSGLVALSGFDVTTLNADVRSGIQTDITATDDITLGAITVSAAGGTINLRVDSGNTQVSQLDLGGSTLTAGTAINLTGGNGGGNDTLIAQNLANTWTITGADIGTLSNLQVNGGGAPAAGYTNFQNLTGNANTDLFDFNGGTVSGNVNGQAGIDTLDYATLAGPITTTLAATGSVDGFTGTANNIIGTFDNINDLTGTGVTTDSLISNIATDNTFTVQAGNDTFVTAGVTLTFNGLDNLTGNGAGNDTFTVNQVHTGNITAAAGNNTVNVNAALTGNINSAAGNDTITTTAAVNGTITDTGGVNTFTIGGVLTGNLNSAAGNDTITTTAAVNGSITDAGGVNTFAFNGPVNGNVNGGAGVDTYTINNTITGSLADSGGNNTVNISANVTAGITTAAGNDTFNFNAANLSGNLAAGTGNNIYNFNGGTATGTVTIAGNDTWNHAAGVSLGSTVTGAGSLTVPNAGLGDLVIDNTDLTLPAMNSYAGHLIIGGTIVPPTLPLDGNTNMTVNTDLLTMNAPIVTNGNITLIATNIDLNNNISAGGIGGSQVTMVASGDGTTGGNIDALAIPTNIKGGSALFITTSTIQNAQNIELELGGGDVQTIVGQGQADPQFGLLDATAIQPTADTQAFLNQVQITRVNQLGVANQFTLGTNVQAATAIQTVFASNLIGLQQLAFIDVGLFEEELSLFGVIGHGIALALAQCEEVEGCAPNVTEEELDQLISALQARIDELERRLGEEEKEAKRSKLEELLEGYRQELENFQGYQKQLQEFNAGGEEEEGFEEEELGAEEFGAPDVVAAQVKTLSGILEVAKQRIDWFEELKADADARAKLSESTGIELTIEALDEIIEATQKEIQSIETQIKLLLEGNQAEHGPGLPFWAESGDHQRSLHPGYGRSLLIPDEKLFAVNERWY